MLLGVLSVSDRSLRCVRGRGSSAWRAAWGLCVRFGLPVAALPARGPVRACAASRRMRARPPRSGSFAPFVRPLCSRAAPAPPFCHAAALPPPPSAPLPFICCVVPRFRCGPFAGWPFAPWLKNANGAPALPAFGTCGHNCRRGNTCVGLKLFAPHAARLFGCLVGYRPLFWGCLRSRPARAGHVRQRCVAGWRWCLGALLVARSRVCPGTAHFGHRVISAPEKYNGGRNYIDLCNEPRFEFRYIC